MSKPIHENPNHPHYGPARRLWIMLAQLDLLTAADKAVADQGQGGRWDDVLSKLLKAGFDEKFSQRMILYLTLKFLEE